MLMLTGTVQNIYHTDESRTRSGEVIEAADRVQLIANNNLQNGETRVELVTLRIEKPEEYKPYLGRKVSVPVGAFVSGRAVQFYALKGHSPVAPAEATSTAKAFGN